jgi:two-component system, response regulator PdtaR
MTRVLIADDETIIRLDLRSLLEANGFEVCGEARDGAEAIELASTLQPDVLVIDVKMPRLDGIEAARKILAQRPLPVVMLTAFAQDELITRAVDAGVFGYLAKPFREQDVVAAILAAQGRYAEFTEMKEQAMSLREALEARRAIERAKGILMAKEGISENEAFTRLRQASQHSQRPMKVIADAVAASLTATLLIATAALLLALPSVALASGIPPPSASGFAAVLATTPEAFASPDARSARIVRPDCVEPTPGRYMCSYLLRIAGAPDDCHLMQASWTPSRASLFTVTLAGRTPSCRSLPNALRSLR